jgi:sugar (pentulose or hexulose) kinase
MAELILGIDVGTTAVKAAVFDVADPAQPISIGRQDAKVLAPMPGYSERDPLALEEQVFRCVRDAMQPVNAREIAAIGISGTACGAWLMAEETLVRPAILWNDGRASDIVSRWSEDGTMSDVFRISGNIPFPGYTVPIVRWLAENEPQSLERTDTLLFCKDYIRFRLTGVLGSDQTDASYAPFDIRSRTWSRDLFAAAGISDYESIFPELLDMERTDPLLVDVAEKLGIPAGIPVSVGATDIIAGCVGGGAIRAGHAVSILGTSANSSIITNQPEFEPNEIGIMAAAPLDRWIRTMLNTSGSMTLDWAAGQIAAGSVPELLRLADQAEVSDLPVLLPYLSGAGVVSPFVDAKARGVLLGLRSDHGRPEVARASVEGLAFAVADSYRSMPTDVVEITAIGGAARSDLLLQTIADACNARVTRPVGEEFGARGVALLAAHSAGRIDTDQLIALVETRVVDREFEPNPGRIAERMARYQKASELSRHLGRLW